MGPIYEKFTRKSLKKKFRRLGGLFWLQAAFNLGSWLDEVYNVVECVRLSDVFSVTHFEMEWGAEGFRFGWTPLFVLFVLALCLTCPCFVCLDDFGGWLVITARRPPRGVLRLVTASNPFKSWHKALDWNSVQIRIIILLLTRVSNMSSSARLSR